MAVFHDTPIVESAHACYSLGRDSIQSKVVCRLGKQSSRVCAMFLAAKVTAGLVPDVRRERYLGGFEAEIKGPRTQINEQHPASLRLEYFCMHRGSSARTWPMRLGMVRTGHG